MAKTYDALGPGVRGALGILRGLVPSRELDLELQGCCNEAAAAAEAPIALVTLVLEKTQFFRAFHGLSDELVAARELARDVSFCQFVVRDEVPFEVTDSLTDDRVPTELVERLGIRAYLGVPLRIDDTVVGALCVIDTKPRQFASEIMSLLVSLAKRSSSRLQELADQHELTKGQLRQISSKPAYSELRNLLTPLLVGIDNVRLEVDRLSQVAKGPVDQAVESLVVQLQELELICSRVFRTTSALAALDAEGSSCDLEGVLKNGLELAHHRTKLHGGVLVSGSLKGPIQCSLSLASSLLAAALVGLSAKAQGGDPVAVTSSLVDQSIWVVVSPAKQLKQDELETLVKELARLSLGSVGVSVVANPPGIQLRFPGSS